MAPAAPPTSTAQDFVDNINALISEYEAFQKGLSPGALEQVVSLGLVRAAGYFESFLESLFFECMEGRHADPGVSPIIKVSSRAEAEIVVYSARRERYLDWLPWDKIKDRADAYLVNSRPFDRLEYRDVEKRALESLSIVRNAIAHPGAHAEERFLEHTKNIKLPSASPGSFLLLPRAGKSEYEHMLLRLRSIALSLAESDDDYAQWLEPAATVGAGQRAPAGTYECVDCGSRQELTERVKLPACPTCPTGGPCETCGRAAGSKTRWRRIGG